MQATGKGGSLAPPQLPQAPNESTRVDHDKSAVIADWKTALKITALTFSLPTVLANLLPPPFRPAGTIASGVLWYNAVRTTTPAYQYQPPLPAKQEHIRAMFAYAPFIVVFATQAYLLHMSPDKLAAAQSAWGRACASHPLLRPLANYPGPGVMVRVAGQMTAASIGVALRTMYDTQVQGRHAQPSGGAGDVDIGKAIESIADKPWDSMTVACVFALPALAFHPAARAKVASWFASGAAKAVMPELLATMGVVAALVALSGAGAKQPSPLALPSPGHPENEATTEVPDPPPSEPANEATPETVAASVAPSDKGVPRPLPLQSPIHPANKAATEGVAASVAPPLQSLSHQGLDKIRIQPPEL
jgi:hypothetical protein